MSATKYTYSIAADFPNHAVATDRLLAEVRGSAIVTAVDYINSSGDDCDVWFKGTLNPSDVATLGAIVGAHSGEPLAPENARVTLAAEDGTDVSVEDDGRLVVVTFPADTGSFMWLAGRGDDLTTGERGTGQKVVVSFSDVQRTEPETKSIDVGFLEQVQLHDGQLFVRNPAQWGDEDEWSFSIYMPATEVVENVGGTGNANVIEGVVVPADGDGAVDVDLSTAVPVPAGGTGFWAYDAFGDVLTPSPTPGAASWHLIVVPVEAYFMRSVPIPWNPTGLFDFDAYKAERIAKRWRLRLLVTKASNGPGSLAGWVVVFREYIT